MSSNVLCYEQEVGCLSDIGWCMTVFPPWAEPSKPYEYNWIVIQLWHQSCGVQVNDQPKLQPQASPLNMAPSSDSGYEYIAKLMELRRKQEKENQRHAEETARLEAGKKQLVKEIIREEEKEKRRIEAEKRAREEADRWRIEEEDKRKEEEGKNSEQKGKQRGQLEELQIPLPAEKKKRKITEKMGRGLARGFAKQPALLGQHEETLEQMGS